MGRFLLIKPESFVDKICYRLFCQAESARFEAVAEKIKAALTNIDKVVSSVGMSRQEHMVLVQNIELLQNVGKDYIELLKESDGKKDVRTD